MRRSSSIEPGPEEDFAGLYARTFARVWGVLGRVGIRRTAERHEVAQDVYLVVHRKLGSRDPRVPESAWVGAIAWRLGLRYVALRRTQKEQPMDEPDFEGQAAAAGPTVEEAVGGRRRYHDIMGSVDPDRRVVFEMHDVDGHSLPEIASALGKPLGTVTTRLRLAREDITAIVSRMEAREAREGRAPAAMLLPFGLGGWAEVGRLFDDPPPGAREQVWNGTLRGIARAAAAGLLAGSGLVGKGTAGALFGSGFAVGGAVVAGALFALGLVSPRSAPPLSIARAPEMVTMAAPLPPPAPPGTGSAGTGRAEAPGGAPAPRVVAAPTATASAPAHAAPEDVIDPEEQRIVERAQAAFVRGNFDAARAALVEHARLFPPGHAKLGAEAEHLRAKLDATLDGGTGASPGVADGGSRSHRVFGTDD